MSNTIAPLLMLDLDGLTVTAQERELLAHPGTGGLIFFTRNYESREQLRALVNEVRAIRPDLLIAVDQEGGRVQRFREEFVRLPAMAALGRAYDRHSESALFAAQCVGELMASELTELGIDISFAPVLDLDYGSSSVIGDRSFHRDPAIAGALAGAFIDGMAAAGMAATGKHFPGHGYVQADSHLALPIDERSQADISAQDMQPFKQLAGRLGGVMPAHVIYQQVQPDTAGFSTYWLQDVLRNQLGFRGVIFSDDLSMAGAHCVGGYPERADAALRAGCDMVLACNNREGAEAVLQYLEQAEAFPHCVPATALQARPRAPMTKERKHRATAIVEALINDKEIPV